ncbi:MAG: hypothetical protein H6726_07580 [Sandaracinaceae bacterium]|nr:hypothetical protein [Sandaracinaceae bacterium]
MRRLFLRLYLTVGVAALLTALGMITLASLPRIRHGLGLPRGESGEGPARPPHAGRSPRGDVAEERAVAFVRETARRLQAGEPAPEVLAAARPWVGESVHVAPLARLDVHGRDRTRLARGEVVMTGPPYARRALLLVPESDRVVVGRLPPPEPPPLGGHVLGTLLLMAFAALGLTLALWPLRRQLVHLADTSERFIGGDLGARVELSGADAMQDIAKAFNGMAARSEELLERHRELLQSVSHEMRTPVARLLFAIEQLADEEDPLARDAILADMRATTGEMRALTDELLAFYRLGPDAPAIERSSVDLSELVDDVASRWTGAVVERADACALVAGDERLLFRAIDNLAANAVRYAQPPTLRLERAGAEWLVHVDDGGEGIPVERRDDVFEPFVRLESSRSRETGGSGLGLAIVRRVVERHRGSVAITQSPERGCRVTLRLPAAG